MSSDSHNRGPFLLKASGRKIIHARVNFLLLNLLKMSIEEGIDESLDSDLGKQSKEEEG